MGYGRLNLDLAGDPYGDLAAWSRTVAQQCGAAFPVPARACGPRGVLVPVAWLERAGAIVDAVAREMGTTARDILGRSLFAEHVAARDEAMRRLATAVPGMTTAQIGAIFGRDRKAVSAALAEGRRRRAP